MEVITAKLDLSGMDSLLSGIQNALIGTGRDAEADAHVLVRQHGKLLAWECSRAVGPKSEASGQKGIRRDLMKVFHPMADRSGADWNVFGEEKAGGNNGIRWLYAGPTYLVGVRNEDYFPNAQESALENIYNKEGRGKSNRGNAWKDLGKNIRGTRKFEASHGRQHALLLNRIAVKKTVFNSFLKKLSERVGRMKATFAYAADQLGMDSVPRWISRHFDSVTVDGKAVFDQSAMSDQKRPSILFGSRAPGISRFQPEIEGAIHTRTIKMREHLRHILNGYAKDTAGRRPVKRRAKITSLSE